MQHKDSKPQNGDSLSLILKIYFICILGRGAYFMSKINLEYDQNNSIFEKWGLS